MSGNGIVTLLFLWAAWTVVKRIRKVLLERQAGTSPDSGLPRFADSPTDQSVPLPDPGFKDSLIPLRELKVRTVQEQSHTPVAAGTDRLTRRQQLRRAVIWAEILAPPVGLRKE